MSVQESALDTMTKATEPEFPTPDEVLALALSIAKPGGSALLLNEDNKAVDWVPIDVAVKSGEPFAVEPRSNVLALDLDTPELVASGAKVVTFLTDHGIRYVRCKSGRPGHEHLWIVLPPGDDAKEFKTQLPSELGVSPADCRTNATRPPLSPHRLGCRVALIEPKTVIEALKILEPSHIAAGSSKGPKERYLYLLKNGDLKGQYNGRHGLVAAIAVQAIWAGVHRETYVADLLTPGNAASEKPLEMGTAGALRFLEDTYEGVAKWIKDNGIEPGFHEETFLAHIVAYQATAEQASFPGPAGSSTRDVLMALIRIGVKHSSYSPMASVRSVHLESGRAIATIRGALRRLVDQGWLTKGEPVEKTATYIFNLEKIDTTSTYSASPMGGPDGVCTKDVKHRVFTSRKALGGRPAEVWTKLPTSQVSVTEVAQLAGLSGHTARRALKRLVAFGLVGEMEGAGPRGGNLYERLNPTPGQLDLLAQEHGVNEDRDLKEERVNRQRSAYGQIGKAL